MKIKRLTVLEVIAIAVLLLAPTSGLFAQQYWDGPADVPDVVEGGNGIWSDDDDNENWTNSTGTVQNTYNQITDAVFSGATGLVTLGSVVTTNANSLHFQTDGYVIDPDESDEFAISIINDVEIIIDENLTATINAIISEASFSEDLLKSGPGTLILAGTNSYTGTTTIDDGVLSISQDANLGSPPTPGPSPSPSPNPDAGRLVFDGGTLRATETFDLDESRGITINAGGGTFEVTEANELYYAGVVEGVGNLTKIGTGTLILDGPNTYSGATAINGGVLSISDDANLGDPPTTPVANHLSFDGGTLEATGIFTLDTNRGILLNAGGGTFDVTEFVFGESGTTFPSVLTYGGTITGTGNLTKIGPGTLVLSGSNAYEGETLVEEGILQADSTTALSPNSAFTVNSQLNLNGVSNTIGSLAGNGFVTSIGTAPATLTVGNNNTSTTFSGILQDGASQLGLTKIGTGTFVLSGSNAYGGETLVQEGILQAGSTTALSPNSAFTVNSELDLNGFSNTVGSLAGSGIVTNDGTGPATLSVGNNDTSTTFSGILQDGTNTLALTKIGTGTLVLSGSNAYGGATLVDEGILQAGSTTALSPNSAFTVNSQLRLNGFSNTIGSLAGDGIVTNDGPLAATLAVGNNNTSTLFSGTLQDGTAGTSPLGLTKIGSGILTLSGANTYTGRTTILGGAITTQNSSALGTGPVTFGTGTALNVQNLVNVNGNWTVSPGSATVNGGTVQTLGNFNLGGGGTLIANANFNVPGTANINSSGFVVNNVFTVNDSVNLNGTSAAVVNGLIAAASVNVNNTSSLVVNVPGTVAANVNVGTGGLLGLFGRINGSVVNAGTFQGTGRVSGNVINNGLISPGASIGTLTIGGNFTQNANGTLRIEVAGRSAGQYDVLAVGGRANLGGRLQLVRLANFQLRVGDQIAFLTAGGGVGGTFANVENDFLATGSIIVFDVVYLPNAVVLEGTQGEFAEFAATFCGTPNAIAVGEALDSAVNDPRASELIGFLREQTLPDLCEDLDLISPEQLTSIFVIGTSLANVQSFNLQRRMGDIRAGSTGFSSSGFAVNGSGPSFWEGFPSGQGFAGVSGAEGKSGPSVFAPIPQNRWGAFVTGIGEFTNVDSTFNASGYDLATGGFTAGLDYRIGSNFAVGLTGGYAYTGADLVNDSRIDVNGGKLGVYATAFGSGFYLDTAVIGGLNGYDTRRTALEGTASGETIGGDLNVLVAAGYDWKVGGLSIGPTASFQYTLVGFDSYSESGSLAPLAYPSQHADSYRTAFGARASYDWKIGPVHFIPEVRAAWQHEFGDTDYSLVSNLASGAGNSFTVRGPEIGRDSLLLSAGFAIQWSDRISTYAYYDGELFRINYLSNNVSVGMRVTF